MYDYGNARVAGMRARLLDEATLRRLEAAPGASAFLAALEQQQDWRSYLRDVAPLATAGPAVDAAIERHRATSLRSLPRFYEGTARLLVRALVVPLDRDRILAIMRRRRGGESTEQVVQTIVTGALLGPSGLAMLARAPGEASLVHLLGVMGLLGRADVVAITRRIEGREEPIRIETALVDGIDRVRLEWAFGGQDDQRAVATIVEAELRQRAEVLGELERAGAAAAARLDRILLLARLDGLARVSHRDPLGIGAVAGYVAALEAQAIRLRAALAGVVAGWGPELVGSYLGVGGA